jgi:hypothetical protein
MNVLTDDPYPKLRLKAKNEELANASRYHTFITYSIKFFAYFFGAIKNMHYFCAVKYQRQ